MFAVSGIMQAILLVMCIAWKLRQRGLHIDDFGHPLPGNPAYDPRQAHASEAGRSMSPERAGGVDDCGVRVDAEVYDGDNGSTSVGQRPQLSDEELARAILRGERTPLLRKSGGERRGNVWQRVFRR